MSVILDHEPQTKSTNKTRELQDAMIRAIKAGCEDSSAVTDYIFDWFMDSSIEVQRDILHYAVQHQWNNVENKMKPQRRRVTVEAKARIQAEEQEKLNQKWLNAIIPMTGAQVRAAKKLPNEMANLVGDNQQVGEVFTAAELLAVLKN